MLISSSTCLDRAHCQISLSPATPYYHTRLYYKPIQQANLQNRGLGEHLNSDHPDVYVSLYRLRFARRTRPVRISTKYNTELCRCGSSSCPAAPTSHQVRSSPFLSIVRRHGGSTRALWAGAQREGEVLLHLAWPRDAHHMLAAWQAHRHLLAAAHSRHEGRGDAQLARYGWMPLAQGRR